MVTIYIPAFVCSQTKNPFWLGLKEWKDLYFLLDSEHPTLVALL